MVFIVVWTVKLSLSYYELFNFESSKEKDDEIDQSKFTTYKNISNFVTLATGFILAYVRMSEPFFKYLVKDFFFNCFGIMTEQDADGVQTQVLSTFLASSLNVELVHISLKGIKKFSNVMIELSDAS